MNTCPASKHCRLLPLALLTGLALTARAELQLLASATSDSYQSLTFGLSGFCQAAGFPFALTEINDTASELLMIPNLAGVDVQQRLWLFWLAEKKANRPGSDIVSIAMLPTADNARAAMHALTNAYPTVHVEEGRLLPLYQMTLRADPRVPENAQVIYAVVRRGTVLVSASRDAVLWAANRPAPAPPAAASSVAGQVCFEFQPAMITTRLAEEPDQPASNNRLGMFAKRVLADIHALSLVLETKTGGVTAQLAVAPKPDSRLAALFRRLQPPAESFWRLCPEQAALSLAGGGADIRDLLDAYETNQTAQVRNAKSLLGDCLTGDSAMFIGRTDATGGLYFAEMWGITNRDVAWSRALSDPLALLPFESSFRFATNQTRTVRQTQVLDLVQRGLAAPAGNTRSAASMAYFLIRDGNISLAATSNRLALTFGPSNSMEQVLLLLTNPPMQDTLPVRCRKLLPDLPAAPCAAALLLPSGLIRQIAQSLPGITPEQIAALPLPGNGVAAAATRDATNDVIRLTLCVSANEIARIQEAMSKGQTALQELFMRMALQQMLKTQPALDLPDPRDPNGQPNK